MVMTEPILLPTVVCCRRGSPRPCGVGVPDQWRALVMERTVCPNADPDCACKPVVSIVGGVDGQGMEQALTDYGGCIEVAFDKLLCGDNLMPTLERNGLYMALSTLTAYSVAPAQIFCKVLARRLGLDDPLRDSIEFAVHEAVVNALLHGNLEIGSEDRDTLVGFRRFCEKFDRRLRDPALGGRCIEVFATADERTVELSVIDAGRGYDVDAVKTGADARRKSGRGLMLIRHFAEDATVTDGGRRLTMRFVR